MMNEKNGSEKEEMELPPDNSYIPEIITPPVEPTETKNVVQQSTENVLYLADTIEKRIEALNKIRIISLKLSQRGDWALFGDEKTGKAEIGHAGAVRIASSIGLSYGFDKDFKPIRTEGVDELGTWYRWHYRAYATYGGVHGEIRSEADGYASTRENFFKKKGKYKSPHEINECHVMMWAQRNARKEAIKLVLGLHHINPDELKKYGITFEKAGGYNFDTGESRQEKEVIEEHVTTIHIEEMFMKTGKKGNKEWKQYSIIDAEGKKYNTFDRKIADELKVLKTEGATVKIIYESGQFGNTIKAFEKVQ